MIAQVIKRLLRLLFKLGIYKHHSIITYSGEITSANAIWAGKHWSMRSKLKNDFEKKFTTLLLLAKVKKMQEVSLLVFYNSRHDVDNISSLNKMFMDCVKGKYVEDDNSKHYKMTLTVIDDTLPKNTVEFHLVGK